MLIPGLYEEFPYYVPSSWVGVDSVYNNEMKSVHWSNYQDISQSGSLVVNYSSRGFSRTHTPRLKNKFQFHTSTARKDNPSLIISHQGREQIYDHPELGETKTLKFTSKLSGVNKSCFFFSGGRGNKLLVDGFYCSKSGKQLREDTIRAVISSIDLDWNYKKPSYNYKLNDEQDIDRNDKSTKSITKSQSDITLYCKAPSGKVYQGTPKQCSRYQKITKTEYDRLKNKKKDTADNASTKDKASGSSESLKAKLKELKQLLDEGLITEEEAAAKRAKLLEDM